MTNAHIIFLGGAGIYLRRLKFLFCIVSESKVVPECHKQENEQAHWQQSSCYYSRAVGERGGGGGGGGGGVYIKSTS